MFEALREFCFYNNSVSLYLFNQIIGTDVHGIVPTQLLTDVNNNIDIPNVNLDDTQRQAVLNALRHPLSLITGPPGTGKTHVAAAVIYNIYTLRKEKDDKILVCSPSNVATDNLYQSLLRLNLNAIRVVSKSREILYPRGTNGNYLHLLLEQQDHPEFQKLLRLKRQNVFLPKADYVRYKQLKQMLEGRILTKYDIVVATCITSSNDTLVSKQFKFVIIDETTQANEIECLVPITHHAEKVILIGDEKQLGPVVFSQRAVNLGLTRSMFERLKRLNIPETMLLTQRRMHPRISLFPSDTFYNGQIRNGCTAQDRTDINVINHYIFRDALIDNVDNIKSKQKEKEPTLFFHVRGEELFGTSGTSFYNIEEARIVYSMVRRLYNLGVDLANIGIITPYTEQKIYLLNIFMQNENEFNNIPQLEIASIDGFQGREKDYIFISCVRSNALHQIGFVKDERRLNVMLTRAKKGLIIVGNAISLFYNCMLWERLLRNYSARRILVTGNDIEHIDEFQLPERNEGVHEQEGFNCDRIRFDFDDWRIWENFEMDYRNMHFFNWERRNDNGRRRRWNYYNGW